MKSLQEMLRGIESVPDYFGTFYIKGQISVF